MDIANVIESAYNSISAEWEDITLIKSADKVIEELMKNNVDNEIVERIKGKVKYAFNINNKLILLFEVSDNIKIYIVMPENLFEDLDFQEKSAIASTLSDAKVSLAISNVERFKNDIIAVATMRNFSL